MFVATVSKGISMACSANTSSDLSVSPLLLPVLLRGNNQIRRSQGWVAHH